MKHNDRIYLDFISLYLRGLYRSCSFMIISAAILYGTWGSKTDITRILFLFILIYFFYSLTAGKITLALIGKTEWCMIGFTIISTISLMYYFEPIVSQPYGDEPQKKYGAVFNLLNLAYFPFLTYIIAKSIRYNRYNAFNLYRTMVIIGIYLSIIGVCEHYSLRQFIWPTYILDPTIGTQMSRARGPFVQSVWMGQALIISILCMNTLSLYTNKIKKIFYLFFILLSIVALYFTYTRGPWVGFAFAWMAVIVLRTNLRKSAVLISVIVFIGLISGMAGKLPIFSSSGTLFSARQNTVSNRVVTWIIAGKLIKSNPILGSGWGMFNKKGEKIFYEVDIEDKGTFDGNHSLMLGLFSELGIICGLLYLLIYYFCIRDCYTIYRNKDPGMGFERMFAVNTIAITLMFHITGLFSDPRHHTFLNVVVFCHYGLITSMKQKIIEQGVDQMGA